MKTKNILQLATCALAVLSSKVIAQQTPVFSDYVYNALLLNPAHAGFYKNTDVTLTYRDTPSDFEGTPVVMSAAVNATTKSENIGFGVSVINDAIGVANVTSVTGSIAYKIIFDYHSGRARWWEYNPNTITFGLSLGGVFYNENLTELNIQNDPRFAEDINEVIPSIGAGFLYNRQQFYVGVSNTNLIASLYRDDRNLSIASPTYLYGGYRLFTDVFQTYMLKPNFLLKFENGSAPQLDANFTTNYKNLVEFGFGYRTNKSVNVLAAVHSNKTWRFLFSYNFAVAEQVLDSTFGVLLSYRFGESL